MVRRSAEAPGFPVDAQDPGRIAQRESVPFTRERSKVRSLVRPPRFALRATRGAATQDRKAKRARHSPKGDDGLSAAFAGYGWASQVNSIAAKRVKASAPKAGDDGLL